jgi:hypothetical protein
MSFQAVESLTRWASRVPAFEIESSDPANAASGVPVTKTINLIMSIGIDPSIAAIERDQKIRDDFVYRGILPETGGYFGILQS